MTVALDARASLDKPQRLLALGKVATVFGEFDLSKADAQAILDAFAGWGNDLVVDYEHQSLGEGKAPAAGWIKQGALELKADGIYATITWTDAARKAIEAEEYRYLSPTFKYDKKRIVAAPTGLLPTGLTNYPGTLEMQPIAARAVDRRSGERVALAAFDAIRTALATALVERCGWDAWIVDVFDDRVVYACDGRTWSCGYEMDGTAAALIGEPVEVERTYAPVEGTQTEGIGMSKALYAILGLTAATLAGGLKEEDAAVTEVTRLQKVERDVMALTGKTSAGDAVAALAGLKEAAEAGRAAVAELAALKAAGSEAEVTAMLDAATKAGKHGLPGKRQRYLEIAGADASGKGASVTKLKALLDELPCTTPTREHTQAAAKTSEGSSKTAADGEPLVVALTAREKSRCKQMGWSEKDYAAEKYRLNNAAVEADETEV